MKSIIKFITDIITSVQKAAIAAHFARLGQRDRANDLISR